MSQSDFCSLLNLTDLEKSICQSLEKTPITANMLYQIFETVEPKFPILTTGIDGIIQKYTTKTFIRDGIFQQLPWLITFFILILMLAIIGVIPVSIFVILLIISILITGAIIYFYLRYNKTNAENLINEIKTQIRTNIGNFKSSVLNLSNI